MLAASVAGGLLLMVFGAPGLRPPSLFRRVDPYVSGLHGRPSRLLTIAAASSPPMRGWLESRLGALIPGSNKNLAARLRAAGRPPDVGGFRLSQLIWALAAVLLSVVVTLGSWALGLGVDVRLVPLLPVIAFACGWLARDWRLSREVEERRAIMREELPAAIDLITLSIMAGESVPAAFARVARILDTGIGQELRQVVGDIRAGAPVSVALEHMKERLPGGSTGRFVDALLTGIERGSPLVDVLRAQSDDGRDARRRELMELGGRREVLMLIPVVFLIMPVVVAFALLPGLVSLDLLVP